MKESSLGEPGETLRNGPTVPIITIRERVEKIQSLETQEDHHGG